MRKDYTKVSLTMYEKKYLECIVVNTKNMYLRKNRELIDNPTISLNEKVIFLEEDSFEKIEIEEQNNVKKEDFEKSFTNPDLYDVVKALSNEEKDVLFYLFQEKSNISKIAEKENKNRRTIRKHRDNAFNKIKDYMENGGFDNGKRNI